jgi:hypothetical protein
MRSANPAHSILLLFSVAARLFSVAARLFSVAARLFSVL